MIDDLPGLFARGLLIGLAIAAPVGAIGLLCIRRTLAHGPLAGIASGLGAATADGCYGVIAGFGLTAVSGLLVAWSTGLQAGGGVVLLWLGWRTLARPATARQQPAGGDGGPAGGTAASGLSLLHGFGTTLLLTLANPSTLVSFLAVFAGLGLVGGRDGGAAAALVAGVFGGSAAWWLGLAAVVGRLRGRLSGSAMRWIDRLSGGVLIGFGLVALAAALLAGGASPDPGAAG